VYNVTVATAATVLLPNIVSYPVLFHIFIVFIFIHLYYWGKYDSKCTKYLFHNEYLAEVRFIDKVRRQV
jgi:hypothetical protein